MEQLSTQLEGRDDRRNDDETLLFVVRWAAVLYCIPSPGMIFLHYKKGDNRKADTMMLWGLYFYIVYFHCHHHYYL